MASAPWIVEEIEVGVARFFLGLCARRGGWLR
jgi:hypothetical protein